MKIQLASDLHLEFLERRFPGERIITPAPDADLLVLAGDIHNDDMAVGMFESWPVPVIYLAGNHEYYGQQWEKVRANLRRLCAGTNTTFLDNDVHIFGGIRFLGCTLWTDFRVDGYLQSRAMDSVQRGLNDYNVIHTQNRTLQAQDTLEDHEASRRWLEGELAKPFNGKTVVVTHHGPHPLSVHPRYSGDVMNAGFVSNLEALMPGVDLWLHGHVHDGFDYQIGGCRVVANPAGYVKNLGWARSPAEFEFENIQFNLVESKVNLVLEI